LRIIWLFLTKKLVNSQSDAFVDTPKFSVRVIEPGIIGDFLKGGQTIDRDDIALLKSHNVSLAGNKHYAVMVVSEPLTLITNEGRELSASAEYARLAIAKALVVESLGQVIVGSFYIRINKPHINTRIFRTQSEALSWLREELGNFRRNHPG
jgi:hypothetical protein